jgi:hypothetical protein
MRGIDPFCGVGLLAYLRRCTLIAVSWMEMVIYVTPEVVAAVEPRSGADENAVVEPLGAVVSGRGATIRGDVIVSIRTIGGYANVDADLGTSPGSGSCQARSSRCGQQ